MVILDPDRDGCTVYNDMMVSYIKGRPDEVCRDIVCRVCCGGDHFGRPKQVVTIGLTMGGYGSYYRDVFRSMELQNVIEIQSKHIGIVLPELCGKECRGAV